MQLVSLFYVFPLMDLQESALLHTKWLQANMRKTRQTARCFYFLNRGLLARSMGQGGF